jgi:hypothetical protein
LPATAPAASFRSGKVARLLKGKRELTDLGWFEVQIDDKVQIEEAERSGKQLRVT